MLKLVEFGLFAVAAAVVIGLLARRPKAPPVEEDPVGARETPEEEKRHHKAG